MQISLVEIGMNIDTSLPRRSSTCRDRSVTLPTMKTTKSIVILNFLSSVPTMMMIKSTLALALLVISANAFSSLQHQGYATRSASSVSPRGFASASRTASSLSSLNMAPRFDINEQKWYPTTPEEGPEAGYGPIKSLLLHGPNPLFRRIFNANDYEQAVLKFMAQDNVSREVAQGNMDAYFRNPQDWQFNRFEEERRGIQIDYVTINAKQVVLTLVWAALVCSVIGRGIYSLINHVDFWAFGPFIGSR